MKLFGIEVSIGLDFDRDGKHDLIVQYKDGEWEVGVLNATAIVGGIIGLITLGLLAWGIL